MFLRVLSDILLVFNIIEQIKRSWVKKEKGLSSRACSSEWENGQTAGGKIIWCCNGTEMYDGLSRTRNEEGGRRLCALQFSSCGGEREEDCRRGEICGWFRENSKRICLTLCGVLESYIAPIRSKPLNAAALRSAERINSVEFSFEILATRLTDGEFRAPAVVKSLRDPLPLGNSDREGVWARRRFDRGDYTVSI